MTMKSILCQGELVVIAAGQCQISGRKKNHGPGLLLAIDPRMRVATVLIDGNTVHISKGLLRKYK